MVGNDFVAIRPRPAIAKPKLALPMAPAVSVAPVEFVPAIAERQSPLRWLLEAAHRYSLLAFTVLFLLVGSAGIAVGNSYWSNHLLKTEAALAASAPVAAHTIAGLNLTVASNQLTARIQSITSQPATLTVGDKALPIGADTIKSWLQITPSRDKTQNYIRIKPDSMTKSLTDLANQFVKAPVDQVTATYADGSSAIILAGQNGTKLTDPDGLKQQVANVAKTVMDGKGLQFNTGLTPQQFAAVTPTAFAKLIEVNVTTHQMYLYDNGQLTSTYAISAGAPATPTPLGEFHIWQKLPMQTMRGFNPNGTRYVQPNVRWINYFDHSGDAVHGNYWRPASVFGATNTSHGCVSLPEDQAKTVYDWAPIGTTVINHA